MSSHPNQFQSRQFIPYQENAAIAPASKFQANSRCQHCNSPISQNTHRILCDLCWSMLEAVATVYWHKIQREWWEENKRRIAVKARLLSPDYGGDSDPDSQEA